MRAILFTVVSLCLISTQSCTEQKEDIETINTVLESISIIQKNNAGKYHSFEQNIKEAGSRKDDVQLIKQLDLILGLREKYKLETTDVLSIVHKGFWDAEENKEAFIRMDKNESDLEDTLKLFTAELIGHYKRSVNEYLSGVCNSCELFESSVNRFLNQTNLLNLVLMELSIIDMEAHIIESFAEQVGVHSILCFAGQAYVYPQTKEIRINQPFTSIISLNEHDIGESVSFSEAKVWIDQQLQPDSSLMPYGKGVWLFTFQPETTGSHKLQFDVIIRSSLYQSTVPYHFIADYEFEVR